MGKLFYKSSVDSSRRLQKQWFGNFEELLTVWEQKNFTKTIQNNWSECLTLVVGVNIEKDILEGDFISRQIDFAHTFVNQWLFSNKIIFYSHSTIFCVFSNKIYFYSTRNLPRWTNSRRQNREHNRISLSSVGQKIWCSHLRRFHYYKLLHYNSWSLCLQVGIHNSTTNIAIAIRELLGYKWGKLLYSFRWWR